VGDPDDGIAAIHGLITLDLSKASKGKDYAYAKQFSRMLDLTALEGIIYA
jgi:hypothetical protein